jgi:predicted secreted protein
MKAFIFLFFIVNMACALADNLEASTVLKVPNGATSLSMVVKENEIFSIQLKGNPTTGYHWAMENVDQLSSVGIQPINLGERNSGAYVADPHEPGLVGFGGTFEFKFKAGTQSTDLSALNFVYKRPWESTSAKKVQIKVQTTK